MKWEISRSNLKLILVAVALLIAAASLLATHQLSRDLKQEERNKMLVWAEAMRTLMNANETTDLNLVLTVINSNHSIPVIVTNAAGEVNSHRNLPLHAVNAQDTIAQVQELLQEMRQQAKVMHMNLTSSQKGENETISIYYDESVFLHRLTIFPYVQLLVLGLFALVVLLAFVTTQRAEQNRVWVGLSKETAHQLGTPISSLMAWLEVLRDTYPNDSLIPEMAEDVKRLENIADRFSKIGSVPELKACDIREVMERCFHYLRRRSSDKVLFTLSVDDEVAQVPMSAPLFEWVVEVLCKNAIDAMQGEGSITVRCWQRDQRLLMDFTDTGKGLSPTQIHRIFQPGYTTKSRGWGLGLSLAKRIVEVYHHGRIYVLSSELGEGTCFRIELPYA